MVDIGVSDKITNLWPTHKERPVEPSKHEKKSLKDKQHNKKNNSKKEDGPGKNIDEYA